MRESIEIQFDTLVYSAASDDQIRRLNEDEDFQENVRELFPTEIEIGERTFKEYDAFVTLSYECDDNNFGILLSFEKVINN